MDVFGMLLLVFLVSPFVLWLLADIHRKRSLAVFLEEKQQAIGEEIRRQRLEVVRSELSAVNERVRYTGSWATPLVVGFIAGLEVALEPLVARGVSVASVQWYHLLVCELASIRPSAGGAVANRAYRRILQHLGDKPELRVVALDAGRFSAGLCRGTGPTVYDEAAINNDIAAHLGGSAPNHPTGAPFRNS